MNEGDLEQRLEVGDLAGIVAVLYMSGDPNLTFTPYTTKDGTHRIRATTFLENWEPDFNTEIAER